MSYVVIFRQTDWSTVEINRIPPIRTTIIVRSAIFTEGAFARCTLIIEQSWNRKRIVGAGRCNREKLLRFFVVFPILYVFGLTEVRTFVRKSSCLQNAAKQSGIFAPFFALRQSCKGGPGSAASHDAFGHDNEPPCGLDWEVSCPWVEISGDPWNMPVMACQAYRTSFLPP